MQTDEKQSDTGDTKASNPSEHESLTSDTSFSVSQFADMSSDIENKTEGATNSTAKKSKVGKLATVLKGNASVVSDKQVPSGSTKKLPVSQTNVESGDGKTQGVVTPYESKPSGINDKDKTIPTLDTNIAINNEAAKQKGAAASVGAINPKHVGSPHKSDSRFKSDNSTYCAAGDITDSSISDIYDIEYAHMQHKIALWHKHKKAKLEKAAEEAKLHVRQQATHELEESCYTRVFRQFILCLGQSFYLCAQLILYANNTELMFSLYIMTTIYC